jgi:hypothetical protein
MTVAGDICEGCGSTDVRTIYSGTPLCDRCLDKRVAEQTGYAQLPEPPGPMTIVDASGRSRHLRFRLWRTATGIELELEETGVPPGEGYQRAALGAHDADIDQLVAHILERVAEDMARISLEPNPHGPGWILADDVVEGRLAWCDEHTTGSPYDVIVDGRTLTWEELGQALSPYEGWRFRLELADRVDDLRPDAALFALTPTSGDFAADATAMSPRIGVLLDEFLADQHRRLSAKTYSKYLAIIDLLRSCLNNYGHQYLNRDELTRFETAYVNDEDAFVHLFGADEMVACIPEFLDYFMVRKVMAGAELLRSSGTVTKKLAKWVGDRGYADASTVEDMAEMGAEASRDLPRAERLTNLLYELAEVSEVDVKNVAEDDYVDDYLLIDRVESGALWFEGGIGPVKVPKEASDLARPGWSVNVVLARVNRSWELLEAGNVYP